MTGSQRLKSCWRYGLVASLLCITSCASEPDQEVSFSYRITAAPNINPSVSQSPSPVAIKVMQLGSNANFNKADFNELLGAHERSLGTELIQVNQYLIQPGSDQEIELAISKSAKHIGVVAGFRDIENASWRSIVDVPEKGWLNFGQGELIILVNKLSIRVLIEE